MLDFSQYNLGYIIIIYNKFNLVYLKLIVLQKMYFYSHILCKYCMHIFSVMYYNKIAI